MPRKPVLFPTIDLFTISNTLTVHQLYVTQSIIEINKDERPWRHEQNTRHIQRQPLRQPVTRLTYIQRQAQQIGIFYFNRYNRIVSMCRRCWVYIPLEEMRLEVRAVGRQPKDAGSIPVHRRFPEFFPVAY